MVGNNSGSSFDEEMECEKWAQDDEVCMDVDLSVEQEQQLLSEISHARGNLHLTFSLPNHHPSTTPLYTVRNN